MNAHIKNTANGGNNNAPQYKTNESNVAVKNRGMAKSSLARRKFRRCCSPRANSSFVPSCGVFKNPVVLIVLLLFLLTFLLFCALDSSSERGIIFPIRRLVSYGGKQRVWGHTFYHHHFHHHFFVFFSISNSLCLSDALMLSLS